MASSRQRDGEQSSEDLVGLLDRIKERTDGEEVSVGELVDAVGRRAFGPLFVVVALIAVLPTGAIPGMSILTGTIMLILSVQLLFGSQRIWLPDVLKKRAMPRDKLVSSLDRIRPRAEWIGNYIGPRLEVLLEPPFLQMVAVAGIVVSLSMYPLAVVPFGAFPAGLSLLVIGLGLTVRDGVLLAAGIAVGAIGLAVVYYVFAL